MTIRPPARGSSQIAVSIRFSAPRGDENEEEPRQHGAAHEDQRIAPEEPVLDPTEPARTVLDQRGDTAQGPVHDGHVEEALAFHREPVERTHEDRVIELIEVELSLQQQLQPREPRAPGPWMGNTDLGQAVPESGDALAQWN